MPPRIYLSGPCKVCGQPAHGNHFGVMSCRACAAFFRRFAKNTLKKSPYFVCKKDHCEEISFCKGCRLKKCHQVGMDVGKFQSNRDPLSSSFQHLAKRSKLSSPQSLANFLGRPELILLCEPDKASTSKIIIDVSYLVDKAAKVFEDPVNFPSPYKFGNSLERLALVLENNLSPESQKKLEFQEIYGKSEVFTFWEESFIKTVRWFSMFPEFTELPQKIKLDVLKSSWLLWIRLEKQAETARLQRRELIGNDMYMAGEGKCRNTSTNGMDLSFCMNYSMEQLRPFFHDYIGNIWKLTTEALVKLDPTNVELNFMLIQLCLNNALKKFHGENARSIEKLLEIQSDNLHDYYIRTMKMSNYSGRLAKMMAIIRLFEEDVRRQREKVEMAKMFDILKIDFSHPEMFEVF